MSQAYPLRSGLKRVGRPAHEDDFGVHSKARYARILHGDVGAPDALVVDAENALGVGSDQQVTSSPGSP
jgi:hypothetical protein